MSCPQPCIVNTCISWMEQSATFFFPCPFLFPLFISLLRQVSSIGL